jgi:uncharacterized protein (TIGR03435 family)
VSKSLAASLVIACLALADAASFEVASIKPVNSRRAFGEGSSRSKIEYTPDSLTMWSVDLGECIQWAYGIKFYQISLPKKLDLGRYDIRAKAGTSVPVGQLRAMLQDLLAKRFKLSLNRETKPIPVYELVVAKGGPKLPAPKSENESAGRHAVESLPRVQDGSFVFAETSMPEFAAKLSMLRSVDRPVVDRTEIEGFFDITLKSAASAILEKDGPSIFTLVQEQLGLKLVPAKAPVEMLTIESAEAPSEN